MAEQQMKKVAVVGASGYTGAELVRLLHTHPHAEIVALTGDSQAGKTAEEVYPHLRGLGLPTLVAMDAVDWNGVDVAFCCLPHGASQQVIATIPESVVVIDLSADFRLKDADTYRQWYHETHQLPELLEQAIYGLSEWNADLIAKARLIACPGCYPTAAQLPLIPLLKAGVIESGGIIIDAKSGVTGAGRSVKQGNLFCEVNEGVGAYGIGVHRHIPEIEQGLSQAAGGKVEISFTPHLIPMNRGILATTYAALKPDASLETAYETLQSAYADSAFVTVCEPGSAFPSTGQVRGSNRVMIGVYTDHRAGRIILVSVIDNLVKGASGQAVQNFNLRFGFAEATGLETTALFP